MKKLSQPLNNIELVLLSAIDIDPMISPNTHQSESKQKREYEAFLGISFWINLGFRSITCIDSSCYDFDKFGAAADLSKVRFFSFNGQNRVNKFGKSLGWLDSIEYSLELLPEARYLLFTPARYKILNILDIVDNYQFNIVSDFQSNLSYSFNPFNLFPRYFILDYLLPKKAEIDDYLGSHYEQVLARSIHLAIGNGCSWSMPSKLAYLKQNSGSSGKTYYPTYLHYLLYSVFYDIKLYFFSSRR